MAYRYIPDRFVKEIDATLNKLKSYELQGTNTQEERTKKKKKQKEIKKKVEERKINKTHKAFGDSFLEKQTEASIPQSLEEVKGYAEEQNFEMVSAEEFYFENEKLGWKDARSGQPIMNWKAAMKGMEVKRKENVCGFKRPKDAKRQTDSANASGTQTNRGNAGQQAPVKTRHEQLQEILQEEHFVLQSVVQELEKRASPTPPSEGLKGYHQTSEKLVALAPGSRCKSPSTGGVGVAPGSRCKSPSTGGVGEAFGSRYKSPSTGGVGEAPGSVVADDRLSTLAADYGPHAVIVWLSKVFEATLVRLEVPDEQFTARQVVQVAEGLLRVLDVYKGLTARQVLRAMDKMQSIEKGDDIMAALYSEWKG